MEQRVLHSADLSPLGWSAPTLLHAQSTAAPTSAAVQSSEIAFVDATLNDAQGLIADLQAQRDAGRPIEVVTIDVGTDGLALIGQTLAGRHDITAIHLLSHGSDGTVQLGSSALDSQSVLQRAGELAQWAEALSADADLLIYGCDLGRGAAGEQLVLDLAALTGADVAASTDRTGATTSGANWTLELATGAVQTALAPSLWEQTQWQGAMAVYTVTTTVDVVGSNPQVGSLRWAISQANANPGTDTIVFAVNGTFSIAAGSTGDDDNKNGDFDITDSVNIIGNGSGNTIINGNGSDRVLDVRGNSVVNLSGLTLQGGASNTGAGLRIANNANVSLLDTVVQNNVGNGASKGGGIYNDGSLTLQQVIVQNNGDASSGDIDGAGIYNKGTLVARQVEIRGNVAHNKDGGGLYVESEGGVTLDGVTLANNQAKRGGGIFNSADATTLRSVTVSGNSASSEGGGVWADKQMSFDHVTIAYNTSPLGKGGGVFDKAQNVTTQSSLFVGNVGGNTNKALTSQGYNLSDDASAGFNGTGDQSNVAAGAGALASNGGFTRTVSIGAGSAARDRASPVSAQTVDQRGMPVFGGRSDVGAYEYSPFGFAPSIGAPADQTINEDQTLGPIGFTVGDAETSAAALVVTATSSNTALVPNASIVLGGSGANRTISLTPAPNANSAANGGSTTITVTVSDGGNSTSTSFTVTVQPVDDAPAGSVTIGGTPTQGQTLSATHSLTDADGLGAIGYQWFANGVAISGATASTLALDQSDVGKAISVTASYTDGGNTLEAVSSAATAPVANVNDAPTGSVTITGTPTQGQALSAANSLADVDGLGTIAYQWRADGVAIAGATGNTLVLGQAQVGKVISVTASYTDGGGTVEVVSSAGTAAVANVNDAPTGGVTISGTPTQGQTLTAAHTLSDADGVGTVGYQWRANGVAIAGATGNTLVLSQAQVGKVISVTASYIDGGGTVEAVGSASTATVANVNDAPSGSVSISGTPTQGQTLSAAHTLADIDGLGTIGYQWRADGIVIAGATGNTLLLGQAQVGKVITVTASYTDGGNTVEAVSSAATAVVANVNDAPLGSVTISGTATIGATLTANVALTDADGMGSIVYQWCANGIDILLGATGSSFTPGLLELGATITVRVSYLDGFGASESVTSAATAAVTLLNNAPSGTVAIAGTPTQGQTLNAVDTLADPDGLGAIAYQWFADGAVIAGATGSTLLLQQAHVGTAISVKASYTDGGGTGENVASAPTAAVANANDLPTGSVTIAGTAMQGQTLSASHTLADADGLGAIGYQWLADGVAIGGATGSTLLLGQGDVGKVISVIASYTDAGGTAESMASASTAAVLNLNDAPTGSVTLSGTPTQGQTLAAGHTLADADGMSGVGYQWLADGVAIGGATGSTLVLGQAEVGKQISVSVGYIDGGGTLEAVTSSATAAVENANDAPAGSVTIGGTPTQGQTLSATHSLTDADGLGAIGYQWFANGVAISGATASTLALDQSDVGKAISVTASYTDGGNTLEAVSSAATAPVANVNDAPTGSVTITGTPTQGQALSAANSLADVDGLGTIAYQWRADGVAIAGATGNTLVLGQAQVGKVISVTASYTDGGGTVEVVSSAGTAAVANVNDAPTGGVTIGGTPVQGQTLSALQTLADADGLGAIAYQWRADGIAIAGATGSTLVLSQAQVGKPMTVTASYIDAGGTVETITSAATGAVANTNDAPVLTQPTADLSATQDLPFTFTLPAGAFSDVDAGDALSFSATLASGAALPSWLAFDAATRTLSGTPGNADVGTITVRIVATDGQGATASDDVMLSVVNVNDAPVLLASVADLGVTVGSNVRFALPPATFADPDAGDVLTYQATQADGSPLPAWIQFDAAQQVFVAQPDASDPGSVLVRVVATDPAGASAQMLFAFNVVAAPAVPQVPVAVTPDPIAPAPVVANEQIAAQAPASAPAPASVLPTVLQDLPVAARAIESAVAEAPTTVPADRRHGIDLAAAATMRSASRSDSLLAAALVVEYSDLTAASLTQSLHGDDLLRKLNELQRQMSEFGEERSKLVASSAAIASGLSIGYVVWLVRGGVLVSSMLSALPAWQLIDPMPVLAAGGTRKRGDDHAPPDEPEVERLFDGHRDAVKRPRTIAGASSQTDAIEPGRAQRTMETSP